MAEDNYEDWKKKHSPYREGACYTISIPVAYSDAHIIDQQFNEWLEKVGRFELKINEDSEFPPSEELKAAMSNVILGLFSILSSARMPDSGKTH